VSPPEALTDLAAAVERGAAAAGFESEDRPFRGHLTLGRMSLGRMSLGRMKGRKPPSVDGAVADADCEVGEVVLFRSELRKGGARYTPLERMALGG
jgi:2'-5' RNA ligase